MSGRRLPRGSLSLSGHGAGRRYLRRVETGEETGRYEKLTTREREILKLIAEGYTSPEIGEMLHLSPKTVGAHRQYLMEKLDLHRPAELIKYAIRKGLVEAEG